MPRITNHSKHRLIERDKSASSISEAKKLAKMAWNSGETINCFQTCPKFFSYLSNKRDQTNTCSIRIYHGNIYIWRGKKRSLVTAHPIPDRYLDEINACGEDR